MNSSRNFNDFERRVYSQNGEDGLISFIFDQIGTTNRYFVEIGAGDGQECNTRYLKTLGWSGLQIDAEPAPGIFPHFITVENIETILYHRHTPRQFDLLSIDVDGNDYWIWKAIRQYHPRVVVIEYNASLPPGERRTIPHDPNFTWDGTTFFGASLGAMNRLGEQKGYQLIGTDTNGVNAFFVQRSSGFPASSSQSLEELYHPPGFRPTTNHPNLGHPVSPHMHQMVDV